MRRTGRFLRRFIPFMGPPHQANIEQGILPHPQRPPQPHQPHPPAPIVGGERQPEPFQFPPPPVENVPLQNVPPIPPQMVDQGVQVDPPAPPETISQGTQTNPPVPPPRAIITFPISGGIGGGPYSEITLGCSKRL